MNDRWQRGDPIIVRHVWRDRVFVVWSAIVVEDQDELLATWIPPGAPCKRPAVRERLPYDQPLVDRPWQGPGVLQLTRAGAAHSVWPNERGWYVNLQAPFGRTRFGIDTADHLLDLWRGADGTWHWKDEHELSLAVELGFMSDAEAAAVRAEAESVIAADAFPTGWEGFEPEAWPLPELPEDWDVR